MKGKIGLFFGTFNPIHIGHLALAEYLYRYTELDQICFVVTPHNPFKKKSTLLPDRERLHLVHLALEDQEGMTVSCHRIFAAPAKLYSTERWPTCANNIRKPNSRSSWAKTISADYTNGKMSRVSLRRMTSSCTLVMQMK